MFERLSKRVGALAGEKARLRAAQLAERMRSELPEGIEVEAMAVGVRLTGRALRKRFALDPALRWLVARLK